MHVRLSTTNHPAADLASFISDWAVSNTCQLVFPVAHNASDDALAGAVDSATQAWGFCRVQTPLHSVVLPGNEGEPAADGLYALSGSCFLPGLAATESVALAPDGSLHLRVTSDTYQKLGVVGEWLLI